MKSLNMGWLFFVYWLGCTTPQKLTQTQKVTPDPSGEYIYVQMPVYPQLLADTLKIPGDTLKAGDGFTIIDEGFLTVVGIASQTKGGAYVRIDTVLYFIENLDTWPTEVNYKKVRASGRCITDDYRVLFRRNPQRQGARIKKTLHKVKWEVIE